MKKLLTLILFFSLLLITTSCNKNNNYEKDPNNMVSAQAADSSEFHNDYSSNTLVNDTGGGNLSLSKYRGNYYSIPRPFINLVDLHEFEDWYSIIVETDHNKTNIMPMKLFVQKFNVSRENFDKANLEWAKIIRDGIHGSPLMNPQDYANQETDEVYNAEIIYTFNDELINNYYLSHDYPFVYISDYENAVATGTYQTRTTDWVDVEAMEAEIIAKYGEAEIVTTETAEEITTETTEAETQTEASTDTPTDNAVTEA